MRKTEGKSKKQAVFLPKAQDFCAKPPLFHARASSYFSKNAFTLHLWL